MSKEMENLALYVAERNLQLEYEPRTVPKLWLQMCEDDGRLIIPKKTSDPFPKSG